MLFEAAYGIGGTVASILSLIRSSLSGSQVEISTRRYLASVVTCGRILVQLDDLHRQLVLISREL